MDGVADAQVNNPCLEEAAAEQAAIIADGAGCEANPDYWRDEVASRLERYRARRKPRAPRYPSLRLPFDSVEWLPVSGSALAVAAVAADPELLPASAASQSVPHLVETATEVVAEPELTNVIEFPRYAAVPVYYGNELAEPIFERPRIVEAPEVLPPPPALGGILMEPAVVREPDRRLVDLAFAPATLPERMGAGLIDVGILFAALAGFGGMFVWVNPQHPPLAVATAAIAIVAPILWAAFEFLFVVYTGSTPGLQLSHLKLVRFDGAPPSRNLRRWRILASYLSAVALGLGYLWSVLDEDGLCWHDRITRTHVA